MSLSNAHSSKRSGGAAAQPHGVHRLQRLAVILGLASILAASLTGWSAYGVSRRRLLQGFFDETASHARENAAFLALQPSMKLDADALASLKKHFNEQENAWPGSYLCVVDQHGKLVLHTSDPAKEGRLIGDLPFETAGNPSSTPGSLLMLLDELRPVDGQGPAGQRKDVWVGHYTSFDRQVQMAAFAYVRNLDALVAIHIPWLSVDHQVNILTLPWAISFGLTVLLAVPLAMWGLSKAYADAERGAELARVAERRSTEQVRILREIDRAILAGGSVRDIARAALAHMRELILFQRASVSLFEQNETVVRILAVETENETAVGPDTLIPVEKMSIVSLKDFRAGHVNILPDLDARGELTDVLKQLRAEGVRSIFNVPLACRGELLGTMNLSFDHVGEPAAEDLELAGEVADVLSLAVLQMRLHEALQKQAAELERRVTERTRELSDVNAELEGYVHSVSHDLRAPLRAVRGFGKLLREEIGDKLGKTEREYLERMMSASERMDALIRDLLAYSRLAREDIEVRPLDTQHVVEVAQDLLQVELDERKVLLDLVQPMLSVVGHHSSLVQAVTNLLSNAAKFVAPGVQPRIRLRTEARGERVRLWVEDNGIGIAPAHQEEIFRVFERLNGPESYPGTGIGLAIVRRAVERMGGTTGVESKPGQGSRFWIDLPGAGRKR